MLPEISRQPIKAKLDDSPGDVQMRPDRPCSACGHPVSRAMLRTEHVVYFRCDRCSSMWSEANPAVRAFGT
jgi:hypothetical protein